MKAPTTERSVSVYDGVLDRNGFVTSLADWVQEVEK